MVNSAASSVLDQDTLRAYLLIQNQGASSIGIQFGASTVSPSVILTTGASYEPKFVPTDAVYIHAVGAGSIQTLILSGHQ